MQAELGHVVAKERGLVASARNGDITKPRIEQFRVNACIYFDAVAVRAARKRSLLKQKGRS
jgi:hypothetical protein